MVLLYMPDDRSEPVVLDSRDARVAPISQRTDLAPVYGLNAGAVFVLTATRGRVSEKWRTQQRHRRWDELLARQRYSASD